MLTHRPGPRAVLLAALLAAAPALAGCMGGGGGDAMPWASYSAAKDAPGPVYEPTNTDSPVRLKLLEPSDPASVDDGNVTVSVLLFDSEADEPVTDASFVLEARMPSMGHGGGEEADPAHEDFGVYRGFTNLIMPGEWVLNLDPQLADGTVLEFDIEVQAGGGGGMDGEGPDTSARYSSFNEALNAEGESFAPDNTTGDRNLELKLLDPAHPDDSERGKKALILLLYDADAGEPVTDGSMGLSSWMPMMGHGTEGEEDPVHQDHGEWGAVTNFTMNGTWEVNLTAEPPDGGVYDWQITFEVGEGGMEMEH